MATSSGNDAAASQDDDAFVNDDGVWAAPAYAPSSAASIKDYSLQAFLGEGSTAHVYLATRVDTYEKVAIKVIDKLLVRQAQMEHKVQREILLHSPLRHRHVVRVHEAFEDPRNHYIVLEYCEGGSVASLVRSLRAQGMTMDDTTAKSIFRQTTLGIAYLHARGIIHRDLKLSNLLLTDDGEVKISDFGLATLMSDEHATVCGTPNFIAPEVLSSIDGTNPYDQTADIWSLGCILYTLVLGKPPFEGVKVSDTLTNVSNAGRNSIHFPRGFSATIADLVKRMLSKDATARPTVDQILAHPWLRASTPTNRQGHNVDQIRYVQGSIEPSVTQRAPARCKERPLPPPPRRRSIGRARKATEFGAGRLDYESDVSSASASGSFSGFDLSAINLSSDESRDAGMDLEHLESEEGLASEIDSSNGHDQLSVFHSRAAQQERSMIAGKEEDDGLKRLRKITSEVQSAVARVESLREPSSELHFLHLCLEVTDLPVLGIAPDATREIVWDCWETNDIRQLTRFTLRVGDKELEYVPSKALIHGTRPDGSNIRHVCTSVASRTSASSSTPTIDDDLVRIVRLCQCLASRSLQLRRAAMAMDVENLPMVHYDRLPESLLESLRRESVETGLARHLGKTASISSSAQNACARCAIPGIGFGEFDTNGQLVIHFFSGPKLQMNASGSTIRYCRSLGDPEDEFDLATTPFLPTEVKKYFEHVSSFVRLLKSP